MHWEELTVPEALSWSREEDMIVGVGVYEVVSGNARREGIVKKCGVAVMREKQLGC